MSELYPEAIYGTRNGGIMTHKQRDGFGGMARRYAYNLGYADGRVDRSKGVLDPLAGWSNLTEAIADGERIDWEKLDGLEAKCVHPELGTLTHKLVRDQPEPPYSWTGWGDTDSMISHWDTVFECAWQGSSGWSLWVKGDIPLRKLTADQLEPGTCFRARYEKNGETHNYAWAQLLKPPGQKPRVIFFSQALTTLFGSALPEDVEVVEVYGAGTFQTPKENA